MKSLRNSLVVCLSTTFLALPLFGAKLNLVEKGVIEAKKPAFLELDKASEKAPYTLIISGFTMFGSDEVKVINNVGSKINDLRGVTLQTWTKDVTWPNETMRAPKEVFGSDFFTIAGGFLVPGKNNGYVHVFNSRTGEVVRKLTKKKGGYWYHQVTWEDMNNDGKLDIITARANKPMFGGGKGEIIWLEQPANPLTDDWKEHFIGKGPDVNFIYEDIDNDGKKEILATEFFGKKLSLWWLEGNTWKSTVLDSKIGSGFDLELVDLNNDGKTDVLATNHESKGSVFAYEIPSNIRTGKWERHTLLTSIATKVRGPGQGSPGRAIAFHPYTKNTDEKPHIIIGGDGSKKAHLLSPDSEDTNDWSYTETIVMQAKKGVIGQVAVADVNNDGKADIFIPAYDANKIYVFSAE
jgi:hypothetical protein